MCLFKFINVFKQNTISKQTNFRSNIAHLTFNPVQCQSFGSFICNFESFNKIEHNQKLVDLKKIVTGQ